MKRLETMTEPELKTFCDHLAGGIEFMAKELGVEKPLFALVLFNDPKVGQYVGNCNRSDMILALRETADRLEANQIVERN